MDTVAKLNREFEAQEFGGESCGEELEEYRRIARNYARMEQSIAVLSDLRRRVSYIYYGGFARRLGAGAPGSEETVRSIWEESIFRLIHPDDLEEKHLQELRFYHFVKRQPKRRRADYALAGKLRMKNPSGGYVSVLHRMFYIPSAARTAPWLALCLYNPAVPGTPDGCRIIDSAGGLVIEPERQNPSGMLSARERQILRLIDGGLPSKEIAATLSISVHTVSRHRQAILGKLRVKNSIEACRTAKELGLI